ncbi:MAG: hypothetical protein LKF99_06400 [Bifidobacterium sp.]|jgi:hypothetical protein|nr:hypothetical protein [Bifidobacterium sp.]
MTESRIEQLSQKLGKQNTGAAIAYKSVEDMLQTLPPSREKSLALTNLEQSFIWTTLTQEHGE